MDDRRPNAFLSDHSEPYAIILGTNEIASAIAVRLSWERFRVVLSHDPFPPVIRRGMAFHDALYDDQAEVDGIVGEHADDALRIVETLMVPGRVAVSSLQLTDLITLRTPTIVVDARMQKHRVTPDLRRIAWLAIGIGPKFTAHQNCDIAVETHPNHTGDLVASGETLLADGVAIGYLDGSPIRAPMDGHLRGIARDGALTPGGVKLIEIDPRGRQACWTGTDERGRAIAAAVVEAIEMTPARPLTLMTQSHALTDWRPE